MIGKTISHYKILEKLGQGGMGVVYKAQDTKLDRTVALKFLPGQFSINEEEKTRFIHEAKAAAALDHPNICTIHEIGETDDGQMFIAMACYEGQTLKDKISPIGVQHAVPLSLEEAIHIIIQIADGLHEAHEKNVIHRDIKSANIIITDKGQVKILDFGLAQLRGATKLTKEGTTLGTINYMSPEQASGERVDHRSDIWSLGVVLYEMLTGQVPFRGDYEQAIVYSIMNEQPEPITGLRTGIPLELEKIINKALSKDPSERYQHTDELIVDLKKISQQIEKPVKAAPSMVTKEKQTGVNLRKIALPIVGIIFITFMFFFLKNVFLSKPEKPIDSIAVLPLENLSGDPEQEYFADGMTDALIGELARINALKVISRTSVMLYKKVRKPLLEIGKELNVKSIVEGTIMHSANRVLIRIQLIETATDHHLWANDFESETKDILLLQQEIARKIARKIKITLTPQEQTLLSSADTVDPRAIDLYLQAQHFLSKSTIKDSTQAKQYLEKAIEISPGFAKPYALLAHCYGLMHLTQGLPPKEVFPIARALAEKAIKLDETLSLAHRELALILFFYDWDWVGAEKEFKRAIELQPGSPKAHDYYGFALSYLGRFDEAIQEMRRSIDLNPLHLGGWCNLVDVLVTARHFDEAIETGQRAVSLAPEHPRAMARLGQAYAAKGLHEKAIPLLEKSVKLSGGNKVWNMFLGRVYAMSGQREKALNVFNEVIRSSDKRNFPSVYIASIYLSLGEQKKALEHLEIAFVEREMDILSLKETHWWDPLRDDPRFQDLLRRLKFPD